MIAKLFGRIDSVGDDWVVLDVGGVGYLVSCSARTLFPFTENRRNGALADRHACTARCNHSVWIYRIHGANVVSSAADGSGSWEQGRSGNFIGSLSRRAVSIPVVGR